MQKKTETKLRELKAEAAVHVADVFKELVEAHPEDICDVEQLIPVVPDDPPAPAAPAATQESSGTCAPVSMGVPRGGLFSFLNKILG